MRLFSFSFHKGWPKDDTGNGGGFVFDARSLPNPGREERFKVFDREGRAGDRVSESTGKLCISIWPTSYSLVDASVSEYQRRGFKNLMVSFGCTGGQHRSVYLAEQVAKHLRSRGVEVVVRHLDWARAGSIGRMKAMVLAAGLGTAASADDRSPEGAGGGRRPHAAGDHALDAPASVRGERSDR